MCSFRPRDPTTVYKTFLWQGQYTYLISLARSSEPFADQVLVVAVNVGTVPEVFTLLVECIEDLETGLVVFGAAVEGAETHGSEAHAGDHRAIFPQRGSGEFVGHICGGNS
jgi:hypothetical protein